MKPIKGKSLASLRRAFKFSGLNMEWDKAWQQRLSFYRSGSLLRLYYGETRRDLLMPSTGRWISRTLTDLTGDGSVIYMFNEAAGVLINRDTVFDYVRFFAAHIGDPTKNETFEVTENEFFIGSEGKVLTSRPLAIIRESDESFEVSGYALHAGKLFECEIRIQRNGQVEMTEDDGGAVVTRTAPPGPLTHGPS